MKGLFQAVVPVASTLDKAVILCVSVAIYLYFVAVLLDKAANGQTKFVHHIRALIPRHGEDDLWYRIARNTIRIVECKP